jgi:hypothetical protein
MSKIYEYLENNKWIEFDNKWIEFDGYYGTIRNESNNYNENVIWRSREGQNYHYYKGIQFHRLDGPACMLSSRDGLIHMWYVNGKLLGRFNIHKKPKQESLSQYIFSYLNQHPEYINEIYILARHNNWLTNDQLALLNCMDIFT